MSNQYLKLRRSSVPNKIPDTGSLDFGELAINTYDGLVFMKKSGSSGEEVISIGSGGGGGTTNTGSFATTGSNRFNGDQTITGSLTVTNTITAQKLVVQSITSSVLYSSGSNVFGNDISNTQVFTGSLYQTGSVAAFMGNVGIGTTSPSASLHIKGAGLNDILITEKANGSGSFKIYADGSVSNTPNGINSGNEAFGISALVSASNASGANTAMGVWALKNTTAGQLNVGIGYLAGAYGFGFNSSTYVGGQAGRFAGSGSDFNVGIGRDALGGSINPSRTANDPAQVNYVTGIRNTAVGTSALTRIVSGQRNNAFGDSALSNNVSGSYNTANGNRTINTLISGDYNTALGYDSLFTVNSSSYNTGIGTQALRDATIGDKNISLGFDSGRGITTGRANLILGSVTGLDPSLSNNIILADGDGNIRAQYSSSLWNISSSLTLSGSLSIKSTSTGSIINTINLSGSNVFQVTNAGKFIVSRSIGDSGQTVNVYANQNGSDGMYFQNDNNGSSAGIQLLMGNDKIAASGSSNFFQIYKGSSTNGIIADGTLIVEYGVGGIRMTSQGNGTPATAGPISFAIGGYDASNEIAWFNHPSYLSSFTSKNNINILSGSLRVFNGNINVTGSIIATQGITGSLQGTSSFALTASFAPLYLPLNLNSNTTASINNNKLFFTGTTADMFNLERITTVGDGGRTSLTLIANASSSVIQDGYGPEIDFKIKNSSSIDNTLAAIVATRQVNDSSGQLEFYTFNTGSFSRQVIITSTGAMGIGVESVSLAKLQVNGNVYATSFTGSLLGTSSFASTASLAPNYVLNANTGSFATTGSNTFKGNQIVTGSIIFNSGSQITSTYYGNTYPGYIDIVAGAPGGFVELLSYNQSSSFVVEDYGVYITTNTSSLFNLWEFRNDGRLLAPRGIEASSFTGSLQGTSSYALNALTASYLSGYVSPFPYTGSAIITGSLEVTGSINITGNITGSNAVFSGTITAQKLVVQQITSSILYSSGSNVFGNNISNTQVFTGSVFITGSNFLFNNNRIIDSSLTGSMSVLSSSFASTASLALQVSTSISTQNLQHNVLFVDTSGPGYIQVDGGLRYNPNQNLLTTTSSYANQAASASYALTASFALNGGGGAAFPFSGSAIITGSLIVTSGITGSLQGTASFATSASYALTAQTLLGSVTSASFASTASYVLQAVSSSFASTASFFTGTVTSASFASTASFVSNAFIQNGNSFGATALLGTNDNQSLALETSGSTRLFISNTGNVGIRTLVPSASLHVAGTTLLSSSFNTAISGSTLKVQGSGSALPIFTVVGSQGELFSINDSLSGSLFSVNDISGLPILEVFSDNTILLGNYQAPTLYTTNRIASTALGSNIIYSFPTSSYDGVFMDYTVKSGSNARAGNFAAIWSGTAVNYMDNSTTDFGSTTGMVLSGSISGSNLVVFASGSSAGWTFKGIIKSI